MPAHSRSDGTGISLGSGTGIPRYADQIGARSGGKGTAIAQPRCRSGRCGASYDTPRDIAPEIAEYTLAATLPE